MINTQLRDAEVSFSADAKTLHFQSRNRTGGYGEGDIWYSENVGGTWQEPKNLGPPFNTAFNDHCLFFSADGNEAFWTSTRPGGYGSKDIWWVHYDQIKRPVIGTEERAARVSSCGSEVSDANPDKHQQEEPCVHCDALPRAIQGDGSSSWPPRRLLRVPDIDGHEAG